MTRPVVIGGCFAGLSAGVELAARGFQPLVLEARPHLGGRAYSFRDADSGEAVDNGQHAMMGCYTHTLAFLDRIGAAHKVRRQPNLTVAMAHGRLGTGTIACAPLPSPLHMLAGVLRYRLLGVRERAMALAGGLRILRMYRDRDPRLAASTVEDLLTAVGQSPHAQASFWNPVAVATLNESPARAAARPFAAVLARAFFGSRRDSQFVLPAVGLSELYTDDARRFIEARGGTVATHAAVTAVDVVDGRVRAVVTRDGARAETTACIVAVPPRAVSSLFSDGVRARLGTIDADLLGASPIVSVHLWFDRPVLSDDFVGLLGTTTQWIFNRSALLGMPTVDGQCISAVISAGHEVAQWDGACIAATVVSDVQSLVPAARAARVCRHVVVKEKQATISTTPAAERARPAAATAFANLFLAGDWTATGLPPTIESAVQSGQHAAALAVEQLRRASLG